MFSYYGSKSKVVHLYPKPKFDKIIEPFAGSARYSLKYFDRDVLLVDKYSVVVDIWQYLQQASEADVLGLPRPKPGEKISDYKYLSQAERYLLGFLVCAGVESPRDNVASFEGIGLNRGALENIAKSLFKIRHWVVRLGSYDEIPNEQVTWFIDPPYQFGGEHYHEADINFSLLAGWCKSRDGQVIVCENTKANWLPFYSLKLMQGRVHKTTEAIWSNYPHNFQARQADMFSQVQP
jgi:hypothetical protein